MIKKFPKTSCLRIASTFFILCSAHSMLSQELYIGSGAQFHLKSNTKFTTSNTLVKVDPAGIFSVEAGSQWGSDSEFVDGKIEVKGNGLTKLPTGNNGVYAPVLVKHSSDVEAEYFNNKPSKGVNGPNVDAIVDVEHWKLSGNAIVTLPWNEKSKIADLVKNKDKNIDAISIVGLNNGVWNLVSESRSNKVKGDIHKGQVESDPNKEINLDDYSEFTFRIDHKAILSINDLFMTNDIQIVSNPIKSFDSNIRFSVEEDVQDMSVELFDLKGRKVGTYEVNTFGKNGSIIKPNLKSGLYFIKFNHKGKQGVKKIIIE